MTFPEVTKEQNGNKDIKRTGTKWQQKQNDNIFGESNHQQVYFGPFLFSD